MRTETQIIPVGQSKHNKQGRKFKDHETQGIRVIYYTDHVISQPSIDKSPIWLPIIRREINKKKL